MYRVRSRSPRARLCPICHTAMKKSGRTAAGVQRWKCTTCNASTTAATSTAPSLRSRRRSGPHPQGPVRDRLAGPGSPQHPVRLPGPGPGARLPREPLKCLVRARHQHWWGSGPVPVRRHHALFRGREGGRPAAGGLLQGEAGRPPGHRRPAGRPPWFPPPGRLLGGEQGRDHHDHPGGGGLPGRSRY